MSTSEQSLLNILMKRPHLLADCGDLASKHFDNIHHGLIYNAICDLSESGSRVGYAGIHAKLNDKWVATALGAISQAPADGDVKTLSKSVCDLWAGKQAVELFTDLKPNLMKGDKQQETIDQLLSELATITSGKSSDRLTTMDRVADKAMVEIRSPEECNTMVKTGISKVDSKTGGVGRGLLTVIAGCPSQGKSSLMANIIFNMALSGEHPYMASLEDRAGLVAGRIMARMARVNAEYVNKRMNLSMEDVHRLEESVDRHRDALRRIHIDDSSGQTLAKVRRTASRLKDKGIMSVSVVDHLGEMGGEGKLFERTSANASGLRDIANDMDVPMIGGCQVNRNAVTMARGANINHEDCIPRSSHLKNSGDIEAVARAIWFCHRPWKWNNDNPESDFWLVIDKDTHGQARTIVLDADFKYMTIGAEQSW